MICLFLWPFLKEIYNLLWKRLLSFWYYEIWFYDNGNMIPWFLEKDYTFHSRMFLWPFKKKNAILYGAGCYHFDMKITNFASMTSTIGFYDFWRRIILTRLQPIATLSNKTTQIKFQTQVYMLAHRGLYASWRIDLCLRTQVYMLTIRFLWLY